MEEYQKRKHTRLTQYDYSQAGMYFVTMCTCNRECLLSQITSVGRGLAPAEIQLTETGRMIEEQLMCLPQRYSFVTIEKYVVMPNHLHVIFSFAEAAAGASPRPTLIQVVGAYKSLTTRQRNLQQNTPGRQLWQDSFYEHIIRDENDFLRIWQYIDTNPAKWLEDRYYTDMGGP